MHQTTQLASGLINGHDRLTVELIRPDDTPPFIAIAWPSPPTICTTSNYDATAAAAMRILAAASTALAGLKARRQL